MTPSPTDEGMLLGKRDLSITLRLLILAIGIVVPILGFTAFVIVDYAQFQRVAIETEVQASLHGFAFGVERELAGGMRSASLLAAISNRLRTGDLGGFQRKAREAAKLEALEIVLSDLSGQELVSTGTGSGENLPKLGDSGRVTAAFDSAAPRITGVIKSAVLQQPVVAIDVPVRNDGVGAPYLLSFNLAPAVFQKILDDQQLPAGWLGVITDAAGNFIARRAEPGEPPRQQISTSFLDRVVGNQGSFDNVTRDGIAVRTWFQRLPGSDWLVAIAVPEKVLEAPLRNSLFLIMIGCGSALLIAAVVALWTGRLIANPFRAVARSALAMAANQRPTIPPSGVLEATEMGMALRTTYDVLQKEEAERRAAESRLRDSEIQRRESLDAAEIGIWSITQPNHECRWDENFRRLLGIAPDAPASEAVMHKSIHPDDVEMVVATTERLLKGETSVSIEFRVVLPDTSMHWLRVKGGVSSYDEHGVPTSVKGVVMNIDELKRREEEFRESEDRYRAIVENAIDAIIVIDTLGCIQAFNKAAELMLGYSAAEAAGRNVSMLMPANEAAGRDGYIARYLRSAEAKVTGVGREVEIRRKDGALFPADLLIADWRAGGIRYFTVILRDLTRRKEEDKTREKLEEQLRQSQKMEAIGQLTGGIAHDFNNLLLAISLNIESLAEDFADRPAAKPLIEGAMFATDQARTLIGQLLAFGRRQRLDATAFDVNEAVIEMIGLLRRTVEASVAIETVLPAGVWPVLADRQQLETALLNLALNARDAMSGSGRLVIETSNTELDAEFAAQNPGVSPGRYVIVAVSDTGTGMSAEVMAHAFEPFYTTKQIGEGSGLGLSQVYGYIKQSGGHAKIYSELGHGTTVKLFLPCSTQAPEQIERVTQSGAQMGSGETILMVEDTAVVRDAVKRMLTSLGYRVIDVTTGQEAIALLRSDAAIDLLFTDMILPGGMGGNDLVIEARRLRPEIRVLLTSGYTQTKALPLAVDGSGTVPLISKPYTRSELAESLRQVLSG